MRVASGGVGVTPMSTPDLNRALLARQGLIERLDITEAEALVRFLRPAATTPQVSIEG